MTIPEQGRNQTVERLERYEAVRLFLDRATAVKPGFAVTSDNAASIADICISLDGLPLAIELAAAHIKILSPQSLLERMAHRLKLLSDSPRDLPTRQQSLRNAIDWSYDLLDESEKALFRRLSVFTGSWDLETAQEVCSPAEDRIEVDVLNGLAALLNKNMIRQDSEGDETRLRMLQTLREYGRDRLAESGELCTLQKRFAGHFIALTEKAEVAFFSTSYALWFKRLDGEYENLRGALAWLRGSGDSQGGSRLAGALGWFWCHRGYYTEDRDWLRAFTDISAGCELSGHRAKALFHLGQMILLLVDFAESLPYFEESLRCAAERPILAGYVDRNSGSTPGGLADRRRGPGEDGDG